MNATSMSRLPGLSPGFWTRTGPDLGVSRSGSRGQEVHISRTRLRMISMRPRSIAEVQAGNGHRVTMSITPGRRNVLPVEI